MQTTVRRKTNTKDYRRNEVKPIQEDLLLSEYATTITRSITKNTFAGVQLLKVDLEPNCVTLKGFCESYYIKQLAQQAIIDMVIDMEITNDIVVI